MSFAAFSRRPWWNTRTPWWRGTPYSFAAPKGEGGDEDPPSPVVMPPIVDPLTLAVASPPDDPVRECER